MADTAGDAAPAPVAAPVGGATADAGDVGSTGERLRAGAETAKVQARRIAERAKARAAKAKDSGVASMQEVKRSVETKEARGNLLTDMKVKAATYAAAGQTKVVRGQAFGQWVGQRVITGAEDPTGAAGVGVIAERLGIVYAGNPLFDDAMCLALRQFEHTAALFRTLTQLTEALHANADRTAQTENNLNRCFTAEGERLAIAPHATPVDGERVTGSGSAVYVELVQGYGRAHSQLAEQARRSADSAGAMADRARQMSIKVVDDVLQTVRSYHDTAQEAQALGSQVTVQRTRLANAGPREDPRESTPTLQHAEGRAERATALLARHREAVLDKTKLVQDKRRATLTRWSLDFMGLTARGFDSGSTAFVQPRQDSRAAGGGGDGGEPPPPRGQIRASNGALVSTAPPPPSSSTPPPPRGGREPLLPPQPLAAAQAGAAMTAASGAAAAAATTAAGDKLFGEAEDLATTQDCALLWLWLLLAPLLSWLTGSRAGGHTYGCGGRSWDRSQSELTEISLRFRIFAIRLSPPTPVHAALPARLLRPRPRH
jgi:hypothetical protein